MANERPGTTLQFIVFAAIGGITTAAHYLILVSSVHVADISPLAASALGFVTAALMNYALNYRVTFSSDKPHLPTLVKFSTIASTGLALNTLMMGLAIGLLRMHYFKAQLIATALVLVWNFIGHRTWTFGVA